MADERQLRIVAMGSSSTQGYGTTNPQFAYPVQLKIRLEAAMPGVAIHVFNKGIGGQDADEMTARMKADVKPERAHLVVWQVGTNSAIRRMPLDQFAARLRAGIDIGKSLGANFVLMNLQYVPAVVALPDEEEYARVMADVAQEKGAGLFSRFDIMRAWYKDGMPYCAVRHQRRPASQRLRPEVHRQAPVDGHHRHDRSQAIDRRTAYATLRAFPFQTGRLP